MYRHILYLQLRQVNLSSTLSDMFIKLIVQHKTLLDNYVVLLDICMYVHVHFISIDGCLR